MNTRSKGAAVLFILFLIVAGLIAYIEPKFREQFYTFVFMGLGAMYSILLFLVDPRPSQNSAPIDPQRVLSKSVE